MTEETLPPATANRSAGRPAALPGRNLALALATLGFAVNFWAWSLLSPLAPRYQELLGLSPLAVSVMVAVPVIVGSLGRIPLGALTDSYGGRIVFALLSFVTIVPVLFLAFASSYPALLLGGLVLGLGGASFAVGVPFVSAWFPPERRGFALGVYGMGNIGSAISGFLTPRIASSVGRPWAFLIVAVALAAVGLAFLVAGRDAPNRPRATQPFMSRFLAATRLPDRPRPRRAVRDHLRRLRGLRRVPAHLPEDRLWPGTTDAASRAAGFVVLATLARPVGGWLADRVTGIKVLQWALGVVAAGAVVTAFQPHIVPGHGRLPDHGGRARPRQRRRVRPGWHRRPRGQRRQRHRAGRRGRRAGRLPAADRHGPGLPGHRRLRDRADAAERRRPGRAGVHRLAPRHGAEARPTGRSG